MPSLPCKYEKAEEECHRFLRAIDALRRRVNEDEHFARYMGITGGKETAAVKRASLDLTRALAEMRR